MRKILLSFAFCLSLISIKAQLNSPNYKQIYDFQVGDIFFYKITFSDCSSGTGECSHQISYERYEIKGKEIKGDTTIYVRLINNIQQDTIAYIDSVNNLLNKQNNEIGIIKFQDSIGVRIRIIMKDTVSQKIIGGLGYNYQFNNGIVDTTKIVVNSNFEQIYEKGIGLYSQTLSSFEIGTETILIGYKKGNDTTGILTTNLVLVNNINAINVYPNPFEDKLFVTTNNYTGSYSIELYTQQGILVRSIKNNQTEILTRDLYPGLYILRISDKHGSLTRKIIKQ